MTGVRCVDCSRLDLKAAGKLAAHGFGRCKAGPAYTFYPAEQVRECRHHLQAAAETAAARVDWLARARQSIEAQIKAADAPQERPA